MAHDNKPSTAYERSLYNPKEFVAKFLKALGEQNVTVKCNPNQTEMYSAWDFQVEIDGHLTTIEVEIRPQDDQFDCIWRGFWTYTMPWRKVSNSEADLYLIFNRDGSKIIIFDRAEFTKDCVKIYKKAKNHNDPKEPFGEKHLDICNTIRYHYDTDGNLIQTEYPKRKR